MDEVALHDLLSGRREDSAARLLRTGLWIASFGYSGVMWLRNQAYDHRLLTVHRSTAPVVSIGNLTTGGTGKTPIAAWITNWYVAQGHHPCLVSRGYRSLDTDEASLDATRDASNDEKRVLDQLCPNVPHLQQRDRVQSARRAVQELKCDVLILDDGFQHRRLQRNVDLVLIDALQPWGYGYPLPRGLLRESMSSLHRADLVLLTRSNQVSEAERSDIRRRVSTIRTDLSVVDVEFLPQCLLDPQGQMVSLDKIKNANVYLFCGIGNPSAFQKTVDQLQARVTTLRSYPDHHHYTQFDWDQLAERAVELKADLVLTTQKDLVKFEQANWNGPPLYAVQIGAEFPDGTERLESILQSVFAANTAEPI